MFPKRTTLQIIENLFTENCTVNYCVYFFKSYQNTFSWRDHRMHYPTQSLLSSEYLSHPIVERRLACSLNQTALHSLQGSLRSFPLGAVPGRLNRKSGPVIKTGWVVGEREHLRIVTRNLEQEQSLRWQIIWAKHFLSKSCKVCEARLKKKMFKSYHFAWWWNDLGFCLWYFLSHAHQVRNADWGNDEPIYKWQFAKLPAVIRQSACFTWAKK